MTALLLFLHADITSRLLALTGVPVVSPALVSHLSQGQIMLVSDPSLTTDHTKHPGEQKGNMKKHEEIWERGTDLGCVGR